MTKNKTSRDGTAYCKNKSRKSAQEKTTKPRDSKCANFVDRDY